MWFVGVLSATPAWAAELGPTRSAAIRWLEQNQNRDGSWGAGAKRWVTTAEALLALAEADRPSSIAAQRAKGWLLHHQTSSQDSRARAIRALRAAGVDVGRAATALERVGQYASGWGVVACSAEPPQENPCTAITSYDTALVLSALQASGKTITGLDAKKDFVLGQRRQDQGWSGDGVPDAIDAASDLTTTAEVVRALLGTASTINDLSPSLDLIAGSGAPVVSATSLELAARLAALHAHGRVDPTIQPELLSNGRLTTEGVWSATDALTNAFGLLALTTRPGTSFNAEADAPDADGDGEPDTTDLDLDGDGVENIDDPFESNPSEWADTDGDGIGDNADTDDDGDGLADLDEYEDGTSPMTVDSDGDGFADGADGVVDLVDLAGGWDLDGDLFVDGELDVPSDPTDGGDHPGKPGDTAPLGRPDAQVSVEDLSVIMRILADPGVLDEIPGSDQNREITEGALDANEDGRIDAGDAIRALKLLQP